MAVIPDEVKRRAVKELDGGISATKIAAHLSKNGFPCTDSSIYRWRNKLKAFGDVTRKDPEFADISDVVKKHLPSNTPRGGLKYLLFDIETLPNQGYFFDVYSDRGIPLPFIKRSKAVCTIAYKWLGEENANVVVAESPYNDAYPLKVLSEQFEQADFVVGHYIKGFDIPFVEGRLLANGMNPLARRKVLDTYLIAKQRFRSTLNSNKLDHLGEVLGVGNKIKTDAALWVRCAEGEAVAIEEMAAYNMQDVHLLEKVFLKLRPQFAHQMNAAIAMNDATKRCRTCGSENLSFIGYEMTANNMRPQHRCGDCGAVSTFKREKADGTQA